jgi:quaternary ammonium compound-resistance protein SugE
LAWIFLILAATCETAWTFCLKFMKFSDLKTLGFTTFYKWPGGLPVLLPFVGYVLFGLANIYLFSTAIKQIPTAMAFAVWTATTLIFLKVSEVLFFTPANIMDRGFFYVADHGRHIGAENICIAGQVGFFMHKRYEKVFFKK